MSSYQLYWICRPLMKERTTSCQYCYGPSSFSIIITTLVHAAIFSYSLAFSIQSLPRAFLSPPPEAPPPPEPPPEAPPEAARLKDSSF